MITINKTLFHEVFGLIFDGYAARTGIFSEHHATTVGPQHVYRPRRVQQGSVDHVYWLALVAMSDRRTNSTMLYKNFAKMFDRNPSLFVRGKFPTLKRMTTLFRQYQIAVPVGDIAFFIERKRHLDTYFGGDPFALFASAKNIDELMIHFKKLAKQYRIKTLFPGAKEKIFCLLAMFLREFEDLGFADVIPIDVWVQSIAASTGVLEGEGYIKFQKLEQSLRPAMQEVFKKHLNTDGAANATWVLGKFGCTHCHRRDMETLCPVYHLCQGPFTRTRHKVSGKHLGVIELPLNRLPKHGT